MELLVHVCRGPNMAFHFSVLFVNSCNQTVTHDTQDIVQIRLQIFFRLGSKLPHLRVIYVFPCQAQFRQAEYSPEVKQPYMAVGRRNHPAVSNTSNPTWPSKTQSDDDHCIDKSNWFIRMVFATLLPSGTRMKWFVNTCGCGMWLWKPPQKNFREERSPSRTDHRNLAKIETVVCQFTNSNG